MTNSLKQILNIEKAVEASKIELALKHDFNLMDAFKFFDVKAVNSVSGQDIEDGLRHLDFGTFCPSQIRLFLQRFDLGRGFISFN